MLLQISLTFLLTLTYAAGTPPSGYQLKDNKQQNKNGPIKFNYGYKISDEKGTQEKQEQRDGIYALGRYYVQGAGASQSVEYLADNWGFHPFIEYSNVGPHSKSSTQIAFGEEAVKALHNSQKSNGKFEFQKNLHTSQPPAYQPTQQTQNVYTQTTIQVPAPSQNVVHHQPTVQPVYVNHQQGRQNNQQVQTNHIIQQQKEIVTPQPNNNIVYLQNNAQTQQQSQVYLQANDQNIIYIDHPQQNQQNNLVYAQSGPTQQPHDNLIYATPPNAPHQDNLILLPQQQYQPQPQYQNMYLVQINDHLGKPELALLPQQALQNQGYQPVSLPPITKSKPDYYSSGVKTSSDYSQSKVYNQNQLPYGTKINAKLNTQNFRNNKLIQHTKNLINGQDVLNINDVFNESKGGAVESSTLKMVHEYASNYGSQSYSTTEAPITAGTERVTFVADKNEISLAKDPIVVADLDENNLSDYDDDKERVFSTTQSTVETAKTVTGFDSTEATVVVTPRPVSTTFLAPITAGVQLQSVEKDAEKKPNVVVEIQKSVPFYLGKFEFLPGPDAYVRNNKSGEEVRYNMELGKSLLQYSAEVLPTPQALVHDYKIQHVRNHTPNSVADNVENVAYATIASTDQEPESGQLDYAVQAPYQQTLIQPGAKYKTEIEQTKEKIEERRVEITKYIDRPYPVEVQVPHAVPYPVEVEKVVEKIVNQPYPVEVPVPTPIETIVEKKVPVPVEVQVPVPQAYLLEVPKPYPVQVTKLVPQPYPVTVTKTVKVPVPTPVEVKIPHPVPVEVPKYIDRPYPIYINQHHKNPYSYAPNYQIPCEHPHHKHSYLPIGKNFYHTIHLNDYLGMKPPRASPLYKTLPQHKPLPRKHRNARQSFENVRIEYGFMPPLIPSLEIDENGKPIEKSDR